jgi:hypothetical protein
VVDRATIDERLGEIEMAGPNRLGPQAGFRDDRSGQVRQANPLYG